MRPVTLSFARLPVFCTQNTAFRSPSPRWVTQPPAGGLQTHLTVAEFVRIQPLPNRSASEL
jgi:hypothetical protein